VCKWDQLLGCCNMQLAGYIMAFALPWLATGFDGSSCCTGVGLPSVEIASL